jgi:hypothetical protein
MIVVCPVTQQSYEIFPHKLVPFPRRCYWNFFTMTWITDQIIPSPYQLECEFNSSEFYPETIEPTSDILASDNNNPDEPLKQVCIWDELNFELLGFAPETHRYYKSAGRGQLMSIMLLMLACTTTEGCLGRSRTLNVDLNGKYVFIIGKRINVESQPSGKS